MSKKGQKKHFEMTPPLVKNFVGREQVLSELSNTFKRDDGRPVVITGIGGIGKTSLAVKYFESFTPPMNRYWIDLYSNPEGIASEFRRLFSALKKQPKDSECLVVIDGAERINQERLLPQLISLRERFNVKILITSRQPLNLENERRLELDGLSQHEALELIRGALGDEPAPESVTELYEILQGHPLAMQLAASYLKIYKYENLVYLLKESRLEPPQIEGQDKTELIQSFQPAIITANDYIIEQLKRTPRDIYKLSPRKFEEIVAELLEGMGWEVKLTQATRDGGMDVLAYMTTEIGTFLCLVEAKKYREDNPVSISIVKELYATLLDRQANSALVVTTSMFTRDAREFQKRHEYQIGLKDYFDLLDWIGSHKKSP